MYAYVLQVGGANLLMNVFSFIKNRIPILDVVNEYTTLKKAGGYWKGCCPFHHEKTASFTVSPHKDIFYCFGCHVSGDVISFISKIEHCSQIEAVQFLSSRYGIELPETIDTATTRQETDKKNHYFYICQAVALYAHEQLLKSALVLSYLEQRGFTMESIQQFKLGYLPGGLNAIRQFTASLQRNNILVADLLEATILSEGKNVLYSPFEDRIIFPITDYMGRFCGFGGRIFKPEDKRPKYYNSRENEHFAKGSLLFGLDLAKKEIQERGHAFLVEGYTDCIAMAQHGYPNTVATLGTACTANHLKLIARYADSLYVLYDGDEAGHQAMLRLTELCWNVNLELKIITLPAGQDPASFLKNNKSLDSVLINAKDIFVFFVDSLGHNFTTRTLHEKVTIARKVLDVVRSISDSLKQDILLQRAAAVFEISFASLKQELTKSTSAPTHAPPAEPQEIAVLNDSIELPKLEKTIFCAIVNNVCLFNTQTEKYLVTYMPSPLRDILGKLQAFKHSNAVVSFSDFFDTLESNEKHCISKLLLEHDEELPEGVFEQLFLQLQKKQWRLVVHTIKQKIEGAKQRGDEKAVQELLNDFIELKRAMIARSAQDHESLSQKGYKEQ